MQHSAFSEACATLPLVQQQLEPILFVLAVGSAVAIAAKRVGVRYNVALVLVGALPFRVRPSPRNARCARQATARHRITSPI